MEKNMKHSESMLCACDKLQQLTSTTSSLSSRSNSNISEATYNSEPGSRSTTKL